MRKKEGGDVRDSKRERMVGGGGSLGLYECSYIFALNAAFIDILIVPGRPLKPITLEESFALSCCKLGCAMLHCLPPVRYRCPTGETPSTLKHIHTHCAASCSLAVPIHPMNTPMKQCVCMLTYFTLITKE